MEAGQGVPGHKRFEEMAVAHVLGGLSQTDGRVFRAHLLECGECRARVGELRAIAHELADVERDERRVRAAKAIETKRRETDDDDDEEASSQGPANRLRGRVLGVVVLLVVAGLTTWALTLRQSVVSLENQINARIDAGVVVELGSDWEVVQTSQNVEGVVRVRDGQLVVVADGLAADRVYGLYVLNGTEDVLYRAPVEAPRGRLMTVPVDLSVDARQILVTLPSGQPGPEPTGATVLEARQPS